MLGRERGDAEQCQRQAEERDGAGQNHSFKSNSPQRRIRDHRFSSPREKVSEAELMQ